MKITWHAHACFRIEGGGHTIVADPYTPEKSGFAPVTEPAGIVIRCAHDDSAHGNADMIKGNPEVVTATRILTKGATVRGLSITAIPAKESMIAKLEPRDNAMYRFELEGIRLLHFGDIGNAVTEAQLAEMQDVDIAFVPTGGSPTIELDDLQRALESISPKVTIPMHHALPGCKFPDMLEASEFADRYPVDSVVWHDASSIEINKESLPAAPEIWVMRAANADYPSS